MSSLDPNAFHTRRRCGGERFLAPRRAFSTRRVRISDAARLLRDPAHRPAPGDLLLARVDRLGHHQRLENLHGRREQMNVGDEIIVAYGNRYAPDQFEATVPSSLGPCHLVAGGGIAALVRCQHASARAATRITPVGLLLDQNGEVLNLARYALPAPAPKASLPVAFAVVGSSMNAGKTTTAAGLVSGLTRAGLRVGAAKLTGTGSGGDLWTMRDAGAAVALDFTDAGHASTYLASQEELDRIARTLLAQLAREEVDVAVIEIADGLFQRETAMMLELARSREWFEGLLFAAGDAMAAVHGVEWLRRRGHPLLAVSGLISTSPLAAREAEGETGVPVLGLSELTDPVAATKLAFARSSHSAPELAA